MLAPPSDYGYSPSSGYQQTQVMHHQSEERPKLYGLEPQPGMQMMGVHEYHQQMMHHGTPHHAMTPQHAVMTPQHAAVMTPSQQYEHEPLVMNVAPTGHYYAPMGTHMLLVSSDFDYQNGGAVGSSGSKTKPGTKRSREDLNMKEKKRMFKLNDRITQLKQMLDDAGVQTKKNKQSVLDNAAYFIEQLQSDLMIAKQKAERAEREAEQLKSRSGKADSANDSSVLQDCFHKSSTPRVIVDLDLQPIQMNAAFVRQAGRSDEFLRSKSNLAPFLCTDGAKLDELVKQVCDENRPANVIVHAETAEGPASVMLLATAILDAGRQPSRVEFSVLPCASSSNDDAKSETTELTEDAASASDHSTDIE